MISKLKSKISKLFFNKHRASFYFSQAGEDIVLKRIFLTRTSGFFVDIGAYHPTIASNTFHFYLNGWQGINIEPRPGSKELFDQVRPKDINLEAGVSESSQKLQYFQSDVSATNNTFNLKIGEGSTGEALLIDTFPLSELLDKHVPKGKKIDFLTCDCEGFDYEVLKSNDWAKYRPQVVLVERNFNDDQFDLMDQLMTEQGYILKYTIPVNEEAESLFYVIQAL